MFGLSRGILALLLTGMLGIAYLDFSTGKDLAVWGLYLIPVALAGWMGGFRAGLAVSLASCVLMFGVGMYAGNMFAGTGYFLLGILNRLIAFLMIAWLASYLFRRQMLESTLRSYEECMDYLHVSPERSTESTAEAAEAALPAQSPTETSR